MKKAADTELYSGLVVVLVWSVNSLLPLHSMATDPRHPRRSSCPRNILLSSRRKGDRPPRTQLESPLSRCPQSNTFTPRPSYQFAHLLSLYYVCLCPHFASIIHPSTLFISRHFASTFYSSFLILRPPLICFNFSFHD